MSKYLYFKNSRTEGFQLPEGLSVKVVPLDLSCLYRRLWRMSAFINRGGEQLLEYKLFRDEKLVSSAVVAPKVWNLAFMNRDELQIGPCRTEPDERGKGYYPTLLNYIMAQNPNKTHVMMVAENNAPSIRGVEKAGFVKYAEGHKTKLHRFVTDKNMNGKYNSTFRLRKGIWADAGEPLLFASVDITDCKSMLNGGGI